MSVYQLLIASCVREGGISCYDMEESGRLTYRWKMPCEEPMYLCRSGNTLYALLKRPFPDGDLSGLQAFSAGLDGELSPAGGIVSTRGVEACHLSVFHGKVYAANYTSGSVFCSDGAMDVRTGRGVRPDRQEAPHPHFIAPSPDGKYLLSTDLGLDRVYTYDEKLRVVSVARTPAGHGPRHLAYAEDGRTVFCANEIASTVTVFGYGDGVLTPRQTVSVFETPHGDSTAAAIRVKGEYVYVSNRGYDSVSCFRFDGEKLTLRSVTPCGGVFPRDMILAGGLLLCANERSDTVTAFRADGERLERLPQTLSVPKPLCILARPV